MNGLYTGTDSERKLTLQELPKNYQLLVPPPRKFQDANRQATGAIRFCSVAAGTDEEIPPGYFVLESPAEVEVKRITTEKSTELPSFSSGGSPTSDHTLPGEHNRNLGQVGIDRSVASSVTSSNSDFDLEDPGPLLPKYFVKDRRHDHNSAIGCHQRFSQYNLLSQEDPITEDDVSDTEIGIAAEEFMFPPDFPNTDVMFRERGRTTPLSASFIEELDSDIDVKKQFVSSSPHSSEEVELGNRSIDVSTSDSDGFNDYQAHRHNIAELDPKPETNVIVVGTALSTISTKLLGRDTSVQSPKQIPQRIRTVQTQTKIDWAEMNRFMDPPLMVTTYTQTQDFQVPEVVCNDPKGCQLSDRLSQSYGHSILDSFGRRCASMQNISDWSISKFLFLSTFNGNLYQKHFSHAEALTYTVMCQNSLQPENGRSHSTLPPEVNNVQSNSSDQPRVILPPTPMRDVESVSALAQGQELRPTELNRPPAPVESDASIDSSFSYDSSSSDGSDQDGYDADDERSNSDLEDQRLTGSLVGNSSVAGNLPRGTYQIRRHRRSQGLRMGQTQQQPRSSGPQGLATVAQVLPFVSGSVIKRIMKRGELKPTMSDYS